MQLRFQSSSPSPTATALQPKIDRQNQIIRGVTAMQAGVEALGHGCMTDNKTLEIMLQLAQDGKNRRQRFGHPGISENATGKQVANAYNFQIKNGNLIHDSQLLDSARRSPAFAQDPIDYILHIAENSPSEFGESVVIETDLVWTVGGKDVPLYQDARNSEDRNRHATYTDKDGIERHSHNGKPVQADTELPVLRPIEFHYVDFVGEGALTHEGLFPASMQRLFATGPSAYAEELFSLVDEWRNAYNVDLEQLPKKLDQLLNAYMQRRQSKDLLMSKKRFTTGVAASAEKFEDEELQPVDSLETEDENAENEGDELDHAEELAASIAGSIETIELESNGIIEEMNARIDQLEGTISKLQSKFDRVMALLNTNLEATAALNRNIARMSGDPVVTQRVPKQAALQLDQMPAVPAFAHPAPIENGALGMAFNRKPVSTASRMQQQQSKAFYAGDASTLNETELAILRRYEEDQAMAKIGGVK